MKYQVLTITTILFLVFLSILFLNLKTSKIESDNRSDLLWWKGKKVYAMYGCAQCHLLRGKGQKVGPALDALSQQKDATMIREMILEPNRHVVKGYQKNIMPNDYGFKITESDMDALLYFLTN